ncbi:AbrB family transcriptional regulator [Synergistales bacterium]|nr:AbrB family transcriptional regulator [Synergistales bacterium]GHV44271.1 AbrB family transcriptional regulator [Synergistales bacterium]
MDVARISVKGQVTIPIDIRRKLGLKDGDKVVFAEKDGNIVLLNSNRLAFEEFGRAMSGVAEELELHSEQDVVDMCKEIRRERAHALHISSV